MKYPLSFVWAALCLGGGKKLNRSLRIGALSILLTLNFGLYKTSCL